METDQEYKIVSSSSVIGLENSVNDLLEQGWRVVGSMSILAKGPGLDPMYYQTVIRSE